VTNYILIELLDSTYLSCFYTPTILNPDNRHLEIVMKRDKSVSSGKCPSNAKLVMDKFTGEVVLKSGYKTIAEGKFNPEQVKNVADRLEAGLSLKL
jgi:hypothetical protein